MPGVDLANDGDVPSFFDADGDEVPSRPFALMPVSGKRPEFLAVNQRRAGRMEPSGTDVSWSAASKASWVAKQVPAALIATATPPPASSVPRPAAAATQRGGMINSIVSSIVSAMNDRADAPSRTAQPLVASTLPSMTREVRPNL